MRAAERAVVAGILALLAAQALSGLALSLYYAPTAAGAYASLSYFRSHVPAGEWIHSLHAVSASALVALTAVGMLLSLANGSLPSWLLGLGVLIGLLKAAGSGNLLPWDMAAFSSGSVQLSWVGRIPGLGSGLQALAQSGPGPGNLTLTRYYAGHLLVLPPLLFLLVGLWLKRARKESASWDAEAAATLVSVVAVSVLAGALPRELEEAANPALLYDPRPEWYFRPLFELLRLEGRGLAVLAWPLLLAGALAAVPLLDRGRSGSRRGLAAAALVFAGCAALTAASYSRDRRERPAAAERLYAAQCLSCHGADGAGKDDHHDMPDLSDPAWHAKHTDDAIMKVIAEGKKGDHDDMPGFGDRLSRQQMRLALEHVRALAAP